jgi:hypothetical protein
MEPSFPDNALKVLDVLSSETVDGYTLMRRTGLSVDALIDALKHIPANLVTVKGDLVPSRIGRAFMALNPNARSYAEFLVRDKASYR